MGLVHRLQTKDHGREAVYDQRPEPGENVRVGIPLAGAVDSSRPEAEAEFLSFYRVLRPLLTGIHERETGKIFSDFSRSGKMFSIDPSRRRTVNPFDFNHLDRFYESARDLLSVDPGATGAPRGSSKDLRSLGRESRSS